MEKEREREKERILGEEYEKCERERTWNEVVKELIHLRGMECKTEKERKQAQTWTFCEKD